MANTSSDLPTARRAVQIPHYINYLLLQTALRYGSRSSATFLSGILNGLPLDPNYANLLSWCETLLADKKALDDRIEAGAELTNVEQTYSTAKGKGNKSVTLTLNAGEKGIDTVITALSELLDREQGSILFLLVFMYFSLPGGQKLLQDSLISPQP